MSENKEYFSKQLDEGAIHVSEEVVLAIAAAAVQEVEGVVALNSSLGDRLGKKNPVKEIRLTQLEDSVQIDCSVIVLYGSAMQETGAAVQNAVCQAVESMTGIRVSAVNVNIAGISMTKK